MDIIFPKPRPKIIVLTDMMKEMINRTLAIHTLSSLVVWYGQSRIGKTTTGKYMVDRINERFDENDPHTFRAVFYETGAIHKGFGNEEKRAIRSVYQAALGSQMDEGFYSRNPPEAIVEQLVHGLRRRRIQLILVDEAGRLSVEAIFGMNLIRDIAELREWTLTIIFIGMDDLPDKMMKIERIHKRVNEWCYFSHYDIDATWALLPELHPYFAKLDAKKKDDREQVEVIHKLTTGLPGLIVPFIQQLDYRLSRNQGENVDANFLRAIYMLTQESMIAALKDSRRLYRPYRTKSDNNQPETSSSGKGKPDKGGKNSSSTSGNTKAEAA